MSASCGVFARKSSGRAERDPFTGCPRVAAFLARYLYSRPPRDRAHRGAPGSPGRRNVTLGGRATSGRLAGACDRPASFALRSRPEREEVLVDTTRACLLYTSDAADE